MAVSEAADKRNAWNSGLFAHVPWLGLAALVGAVGCCAAAAFVVIYSDGQLIHDWTLPPTVYLAIASAATNILLPFALTKAINVAWWRRSLQEGTTVNDLHCYWNYATSLWAALTSGRRFNLVALASIVVALTPLNGPLLQRVSTATYQSVERRVLVSASIVPELPDGYTGTIGARLDSVALLSPAFTSVMRAYTNHAQIPMNSTGCADGCSSTLKGAGFSANCSISSTPFTLEGTLSDGKINYAAVNGTNIFTSNFTHNESTPGDITLVVTYKGATSCTGYLNLNTCVLRAATMEYDVSISDSGVYLSRSSILDDKLISISKVAQGVEQGSTTLGGMALALSNKFDSAAHMRRTGTASYQMSLSGSLANEYAVPAPGNTSACGLSWADPTPDLLAAAREVMFRTAVYAANSSNVQTSYSTDSSTRTIYRSNYKYLGLALLVTLPGIGFVAPMFFGWWCLGRKTSLSPVETAKAFNAPLLRGFDSNGDADALLKDVGDRKVKYGEVAILGGQAVPRDTCLRSTDSQLVRRLELSSPEWVRSPQDHMTYSG